LSLAGHGLQLDDVSVIDIPLRVIHPEYYPHLFSLCAELGVSLRKLEHSGSFAQSRIAESFEYFSVPLFRKRFNLIKFKWSHLKIAIAFMKFYFLCHQHKDTLEYENITFGEFLKQKQISSQLSNMILYPLLSSICTCRYDELDQFPARLLLEMMSMIAGPVPMERFYAGTHDIETALAKHINKIHLDSKVDQVVIHEHGGELFIGDQVKKFDHIVVSTEAHVISNFLQENQFTHQVLKDIITIPYKTTDTIIHTVDKEHQQVQNQKSLHYQEHPGGNQAQASMWLNKVEPHLNLKQNTLQTWNPYEKEVVNELKRSSLNRALVSVDSYGAVKRLREFKHTSFSLAGSYLAKGIPLLEGGVESAYRLSQNLD
jgi:predicted NAD/FAD-binding protein